MRGATRGCGGGGEMEAREVGGGVGVVAGTTTDVCASCLAPSSVMGSARVALSSSSSLNIISCRGPRKREK